MGYVDYDEDILKHVQQVELSILKDFVDICNENDLEYFLYGGTALGAVRHSGFIPWDDDIDVAMFRKDYEKFLAIMEKKNIPKYKMLNVNTEKDYFLYFSKMMLRSTYFEEWWVKQVDFNVGINIDIFPLDNIPENKFKRSILTMGCRFFDKLSTLSVIKIENLSKTQALIANTLHFLLKTFKIHSSLFNGICLYLMKKYENEHTNKICDFSALNFPQIYDKKDFTPAKNIKFENMEAKISNNIDSILTQIYGDYMKIPPVEERYNHLTENIDFGEY